MLFTIRNDFRDDELDALYEIECECFNEEFRWAESAFQQAMAAARDKSLVWVACIGSRIAGYLIAEETGSSITVDTCAVGRVYRHKGIATRLMTACETEVYVQNPAQILYFQIGYRACGYRRNYYGMKKDAISMMKTI